MNLMMKEIVMSDKNQPAFPHTVVDSSTNFDLDLIYSGMTLRQYAAIKLKVPDSGTDWLDDMINKSLLDDFAAKAMQGLMNTEYRLTDASYKAKQSYAIADAMLAAREAK
jgi:hypothetical protein